MMRILIVENDPAVAAVLKQIIEIDRAHFVTAIASELEEVVVSLDRYPPHLMLIDLHLSGNATGIEVAARAKERSVPALFTTANPLPFPVPELALGCLCKPYNCNSVARALRIAERIMIGETASGDDVPPELELY